MLAWFSFICKITLDERQNKTKKKTPNNNKIQKFTRHVDEKKTKNVMNTDISLKIGLWATCNSLFQPEPSTA